ncbi:DMT family transporter [Sulfitobacter mediterraneus]|jgi:drug/metabolite transporter (DMT)-like permease|uniref:EamA-like transporter family protein n=1 Tax=Sulfitobacter mediterraneus TaxID=83219 RepID=A0A2T6CAY9_9RHOB|nr:DMT family transporter [Sulfitobacter mediterraneus]KIN79078.1 putative, membrane protein [Sulfitobacter mediterraneus KCTC 32188]PTX72376.1 EamA-like transporter family protein [Sulfitobacter mediterraneus]UWR10236.1 DMT family transporter [Sulfitobacter mediterraneus]
MNIPFPDLWIIVSLAAAAFQTVRFMLQKHLATATLSAGGATFSRFLYSIPFILALLAAYLLISGKPMPQIGAGFWIYGLAGATAQILATVCVVMLFKQRNFAVGITFKKTEVIQTVLMGWILLGEGVSTLGFAAIALGIVGLLLLSGGPEAKGWQLGDLRNRAAGLGLASGILFSISAVSYRGASLTVVEADPILRAAVTLAAVVTMQTLIMVIWLRLREPGEITAVWSARKVAIWIGLTSMGGSLCWFIAFTLQNAAYVKAVGQAELILSVAASTLFFQEKITPREWAGMAILMASILMLVLVI